MIPANLKGSDKTVYNVHIRLFKSQGMCVKEAHEQAMKKVESTRKVIADDARYEKSRRRYV